MVRLFCLLVPNLASGRRERQAIICEGQDLTWHRGVAQDNLLSDELFADVSKQRGFKRNGNRFFDLLAPRHPVRSQSAAAIRAVRD